jgi:hypothetical protein
MTVFLDVVEIWKNQLLLSSTFKKEATGSCERLINIYQTAQHHIIKENILHCHHCGSCRPHLHDPECLSLELAEGMTVAMCTIIVLLSVSLF